MKRWTIVMACALAIGLVSAPVGVYADHHGAGGTSSDGSGGGDGDGDGGGDGGGDGNGGGACGGDGMGKSEGSH